ncbi:IclR family transcriptional regulator [Microbaculum marinisediminis]|uniref:IclR family transcriptional regulator n=1 Tax=Microbaculum marinisediminis TaxID=2931392 RepID=A0AAW5QTJ9_9HYPH|nr:IclR family transcriptional regulator [Microbaculum sp. A6E488]MCT8971366.1 IclR family transcriptional regulator [Microbaculum sp. A6E488]
MAAVKAKDTTMVVSLARGLNILRAFRAIDAPLGNKEIAERTALPKATVARLSYTLSQMGYLRQVEPHGQYHLGDKVTALGHALLRSLPVRRVAEPLMQALADKYEMSVALGIGDGPDMVYLHYCSGPETVTMRLRIGSLVPIAQSAMGRAYMWALPEAEREHHMQAIRAAAGDKADTVEAELRAEIAEVDRRGFSVSFGAWRREIFAVGAPVWLDRGETVLALNCGTRRRGLNEAHFQETLGPELMALSSELGHRMDQLGASFWDE